MNELYFYLITMVRGFVKYFYTILPVYVGGGVSTPIVFSFDVFICVLLKAESTEVVLIVVRDIVIIEVYCQGCEWYMIV